MRFVKRFLLYITLPICLLGGLVSCDKAEYTGPPRFALYLEDAPADYTYLRTSLRKIELQQADGAWVVIKEPYMSIFDIILLSGGQMLKVADQEIPAGKYIKLRVTFSENGAELGKGTENEKLPITPRNQVQEFAIDMTADEDLQSYLILDINAVNSVTINKELGNSFTPACTIVNYETLGTLWGMVGDSKGTPIAETMLVEVRQKISGNVSMTYTNRNTAAIFQRLAPGTYDVTITPGPTSKYAGTRIENVSVDAQQSTQMGMIRLTELPK